jgi:type II secretory pathway component GspD/PulD (secretin)
MIEVVILDVQLENDTEIGVNWDRLFDPARDESYSQLLVTTLSTTGVTGADFSLIKTSISGTIHALQETRDIEILASPRVLVVSGEQAQIQTVEEIPYRELIDTAAGGEAALTSTEFREVGVTLKVKATVTDERKILLVIESEQSINTGEEGIEDVPIIDKRLAKTTLLMDDGQIVAMGGLRRKETKFIVNKIPILGDLPLVGMFFSDDQKIANEYELLILISPHIYKGEPIDDEQMKKFNELRERPMLSMPDDSKMFLRIPTNAEQKKNNIEQKKKQLSKQKYPTSAE